MWEALTVSLVTVSVTFGVLALLVVLLLLLQRAGGEPDPEDLE